MCARPSSLPAPASYKLTRACSCALPGGGSECSSAMAGSERHAATTVLRTRPYVNADVNAILSHRIDSDDRAAALDASFTAILLPAAPSHRERCASHFTIAINALQEEHVGASARAY